MATNICIRLGKRIRQLRKARGWRQIDLAEYTGISQNHICDLERGQAEVGLMTLEAVVKALDITPSEILKGL
jgi:XRE family aerobic/anaerobic benzoate catabolism transcriptional regulator